MQQKRCVLHFFMCSVARVNEPNQCRFNVFASLLATKTLTFSHSSLSRPHTLKALLASNQHCLSTRALMILRTMPQCQIPLFTRVNIHFALLSLQGVRLVNPCSFVYSAVKCVLSGYLELTINISLSDLGLYLDNI